MSFIGTGKIKLAAYASGVSFALRKFIDTGNASTLEYTFSEEKKELKDYQDPAGGVAASVSKVDKVEGKMTLRKISAANLAMALWGTSSVLNTTAITGEAHVINADSFIPTNRLINTSVAPVVKKGATVVAAGDYTVSKGGITIAATIGTAGVVNGDSITIDYTPLASLDVQALVSSAPDMSLFFEGVNAVDGKYCTDRLFKIKLGTASNISRIGDDFASLDISFTVQKDTTVTGAGISQFLKLEIET
ncbi:hypothetical protein [Dechloromonas sp. CZR5]|uniref:phage tail tube protein n=1 Tax=Dechloromonas sp. CZR5 TaxID=2608630 RepID=UPI00123D9580|nr:hypothetical protein [Dechloromonas sp. CZR5]